MHELIAHLGLVSEPRCRRILGRHEWRCTRRRAIQIPVPAGQSNQLFHVRFECPHCQARALVITPLVEHLWLLGVEIPATEEPVS